MITFKGGFYNPKFCSKHKLNTLMFRDKRLLFKLRKSKSLYILKTNNNLGIIICK